mgnify:CR=1 FL=1
MIKVLELKDSIFDSTQADDIAKFYIVSLYMTVKNKIRIDGTF